MKDPIIERFEAFTYSINSIYRHVLKIERDEMEKLGYRGSYALYLAIMSRFPDGVTASKLSEISHYCGNGSPRSCIEKKQ